MELIRGVIQEFCRMKPLTLVLLLFLIAVGLYDLYRVMAKKKTISRKVHEWTGKAGDACIMIGILILIYILLGPDYFVTVMAGVIVGHFFWQGRN